MKRREKSICNKKEQKRMTMAKIYEKHIFQKEYYIYVTKILQISKNIVHTQNIMYN